MNKHTAGPWSINNWPQPTSDVAIGAAGTPLIARVMLRDVSINQQQANAHLIAAAPELLEALRHFVGCFAQFEEYPNGKGYSLSDIALAAFPIARAAIAKAEGGAP